jgi:hypothetical protein
MFLKPSRQSPPQGDIMHKAFLRFVVACTAVLGAVVAPGALAQYSNSYFISQDTAGEKSSGLTIWVAECQKFDAKNIAKPQSVSCTLTPSISSNTCEPCYSGDAKKCSASNVCKFLVNSTDEPPMVLIFGRSKYNPTCGYVYDPMQGRYVYRCW